MLQPVSLVHDKVVPAEIMHVTPERAQQWLTENPFEGQRPLRPSHVRELAGIMAHGAWRPTEITLGVCNNKVYVLNGQHRLNAVVQYGQPVPMLVIWRIFTSFAELIEAYTVFDRALRARTVTDTYNALGLPEKLGLTSEQSRLLSIGVVLIASGFRPTTGSRFRATDDMRALLMEDWAPTARMFFEAMSGATSATQRILTRGATMAALLVVVRYHPRGAEFVTALSRTSFEPGNPLGVLYHYLLHVKGRAGEWLIARHVALAWNYWLSGKSVSKLLVMHDSSAKPIRFDGTPYDGKQFILPLGDL